MLKHWPCLPATILQNADDNRYAAGAVPALEFLLLPDAVAALNNESGLTAADVRALCDVGASTKLAKAYIGYKGIGCKSMFKVGGSLCVSGTQAWLRGCMPVLVSPRHSLCCMSAS
jgi:hypothetical protein